MANSDTRFIYTDDEGNLFIVCPADNTDLTLEQIKAKDCPSDRTVYTVDKSAIPTDNSFSDARTYTDSGFGIDMAKAKEIHKTKIREARTSKLAELDVEFQKAQETSADTSAIVTKKNALRDAPADSAIDAATDEAGLKAQWNTSILGTSPYS
jgi:hypothetical protein